MGKHESMAAIRAYKHRNHIVENRNGIIYNAFIHAEDSTGRNLFSEETEFLFSTNKHGDEEVDIVWPLPHDTYRMIGLHGAYSVNICQIDFIGDKLMIHNKNIIITIGAIL